MTDDPCSLALTEWQTADTVTCPDMRGMSLQQDPPTQSMVRRLNETGMLHVIELRQGLQVRTTSFVGRLQIGDLEITIRPKIVGAPLLRLLRFAYGLRDLRLLTTSPFGTEPDSLQDLLIAQLAAEAREIIARGLQRQYVRHERELASPRGRIDVQVITQRGVFPLAALPCIAHERLSDTILNQVLLAGLHLAGYLTTDSALATDLYRSALLLAETTSPIKLNGTALHAAHRYCNRLTVAYLPALRLIELLLTATGVSLNDESESLTLHGFLFDMNRFYQSLLSRFLAMYLPDYVVEDQRRLHGMFRYDPARNPQRRQSPTPRPDFLVRHGRSVVAILDAKYRDLWSTSLPADMLYQLAVYALSQEAGGAATILYPTLEPSAQEAQIIIHRPIDGRPRGRVCLRPVRLDLLDGILSDTCLPAPARQRACRSLAETLAFGP